MISQKYPLIAAAVAATLAAGVANATVPTLGQAAAPAASLVIAGSSAAESSVQAAVGADICGGAANMLTMKSAGGSGNFFSFSCTPSPAISGVPAGVVTIYYRTEGGSVVGALPVVSEAKIKRLSLSDQTCTASGTSGTCSITGLTATAGTQDSWGGAVTADFVQLGVTDVEPAQLGNLGDYPSGYSTAVFGTATAKQLAALPTSRIFQQVFGIVVNTTGGAFTGTTGVNLSKEAVQNILLRNYTDWSNVPSQGSVSPLVTTSQVITPIDREQGSGTRTATNIYFLNYGCGATGSIDSTGETLNFSTTDELNAAESTPGAIAYTSIDQILKAPGAFPNLVLASINGVKPTNLNAASGAYDFWFEATFVTNSAQLTGAALQLATVLENKLPVLANAPGSPDINVIPNYKGNIPALPIPSIGSGTTQIYVNPFTRSGNSCGLPVEQN
jgi:PBP superfamily domain